MGDLRLPSKTAVRTALIDSVRAALQTIASAAAQTREGATHEENRSEGDKDMRATEQSYLARGQAMRAEDLAEQLTRLETSPFRDYDDGKPIGPGALVGVSIEDELRIFLVVPQGGGTELVVEGHKVTVITPSSPVGSALVGRSAGDDFELAVRGARREWVIEAVR